MNWLAVTLVLMLSVLLIVVAASVIEHLTIGEDNNKRTMGALSTCLRDLRKRQESWKDAFIDTDAQERGKLDPVKAFAYADITDLKDNKIRIDYGIAIGYTASFLTDPIKQVSYVLYSEDADRNDATAKTKEKISQRQHMLHSMHQSMSDLISTKSGFSNVELITPCVLPSSYEYFLY